MTELLRIPEAKLLLAGAGSDVLRFGDAIIEHGLEMSGAEHSSVLLIPTAEPTQEWYDELLEYSQDQFTKNHGLHVDVLHPFREGPGTQEMTEMFGRATHLWIAGGDTKHMLEFWEQHGIIQMIESAVRRGVVFMGGSAAALAPMLRGHSDYQSYRVEKGQSWKYEMIDGLGWIAVAASPHFDGVINGEKRSDNFISQYATDLASPDIALGLDNMAGLAIIDGKFRVIQSPIAKFPHQPNVHVLRRTPDSIEIDQLPVSTEYQTFDLAA